MGVPATRLLPAPRLVSTKYQKKSALKSSINISSNSQITQTRKLSRFSSSPLFSLSPSSRSLPHDPSVGSRVGRRASSLGAGVVVGGAVASSGPRTKTEEEGGRASSNDLSFMDSRPSRPKSIRLGKGKRSFLTSSGNSIFHLCRVSIEGKSKRQRWLFKRRSPKKDEDATHWFE